jgi:hypothetical protein
MKNISKNRRTVIFAIILINIILIPYISQIITKYIPKNGLNKDFKPKLSAPPTIVIDIPSLNDLFGSTAPDYNVTITDGGDGVNETWYTIDSGSTNITFTDNGTIDQNEWDLRPNGTVTITFYANDTLGVESSESVNVYRDVLAPLIAINSPSNNDVFNATAPIFDVTITDGNLDTMWYFITGSSVNRTFLVNEQFNQNDWDGIANGTLTTITFYANDTLGNESSQSVSIYVDRLGPSITINSPSDNDVFSSSAPVFDVTITDGNLDTMWYFIEGSSLNRTFSGNEAFNQNDWDGITNGTLTTITFYANDTFGNETSQSVSIYVDRLGPSITINSPSNNDVFNATAPVFDVTITDGNLDTMWYFIAGSSVNRTFLVNEQFNQNDWNGITNGTLTTITFYANDTFGNETSQSVNIYVDKLGPSIIINSPNNNDVFNATAPVFDVTISDGNLDTMWYFITGSSVNRTFLVNEQFNQNDWDGITNGTLTIITFYANDTFGNETSQSISIYVDRLGPSITINSPSDNDVFGATAPVFDVTITDGNLDTMWYFIEGSSLNRTFSGNEAFNQNDWDGIANGTLTTITFYANDTFGNETSQSVSIYVDRLGPIIIINSPSDNDLFNATAPVFDVSISDGNLDTMWYFITGSSVNRTFLINEQFNQNDWDGITNGTLTIITFYANDTFGNETSQSVSIYVDNSGPIIIINSPNDNDVFNATAPVFDVTITDGNLDTMWYFIEGSSVNRTFLVNEQFNQNDWNSITNGTLTTIMFYANDTFGYETSQSVSIYVDRLGPSIAINSPSDNDVFGVTAPVFDVTVTDGNLDTMWYFIEGSSLNRSFSGNEAFNQNDWDGIANGTLTTITFYANDSFGNETSQSVSIYVDRLGPTIIINSPSDNDLFNATAPVFDVSISDGNLDSMWYFIEGSSVNRTFLGNEVFNQNDWDGITNGTLTTITFYANDTFGNETSQSVSIYVDNTGPSITINSPNDNDVFNATAPLFDVTIIDGNLDTMWYFIEGSSVNRTFLVNEAFNQNDWDGITNGTLTIITFYANDTFGYETSLPVSIYVDRLGPSITINSPIPNQLCGINPPSYDVSIADGNLDEMWYGLVGGTKNITFIANGIIDSLEWNLFGNELVTIIFYANDTLGNENSSQVTVIKSIDAPQIIINSPLGGQVFNATAPYFNVTIIESDLDTSWYTIDNGITNITFTGNNTLIQINQNNWTAHIEGSFLLIVYANDTSNNIGSQPVNIVKDATAPSIIINSPNDNDVLSATAPIFDVTIIDGNLDTMWYFIEGSSVNRTFVVNETFNQNDWDGIVNGTITTITFYANDLAGNETSQSISIYVDNVGPSIIINAPTLNQLYSSIAPNFNVTITDGNFNTSWYTLDGGVTNYIFIGTTGTINQTAWDTLLNGTVTIRFVANDTFGNLNYQEIDVQKDVLAPIITINSPTSNQLFTHVIPQFDLTLVEGNLNTSWYTTDGGLTNYTFIGTMGTLNQAALFNGTITIRFYANDTLGNLDYSEVTIRYDILSPKPFILSSDADSPDTDGQFELNWTISIGAVNYSIYMYSSLITDINSSVTLVASGLTDLSYSISNESGTYYFMVRSYNETGFTDSNQIMITVAIPLEGAFDLMSFLTNPLTIINFGLFIGLLTGIILKIRKKYYKSGDKEIRRIEEIRRKKD